MKKTDNRENKQVGFKKLQFTRLYKIIWKTPNAEIPKRNFSLLSNPLVLFNRILKRVAFILQKDNKVVHLRNKKIFRTTKPQAPVKLIIDNAKLSSIRDIGTNTSCQYLQTLVEYVYQTYHRI
jgi:hypothetical protein